MLGSPGETSGQMLQDHKRGRRHISTQNLKAFKLMGHLSYTSYIFPIHSRYKT
jgi:hypothetical protein